MPVRNSNPASNSSCPILSALSKEWGIVRGSKRPLSFALAGTLLLTLQAHAADPKATCRVGVIEGEVAAGKAFTRPLGDNLSVLLEPLPSGWILRIIPASGPRPDHDFAELATPPYHSISPLLISTDFAFRAQDAVGWNPRRFRFATSPASFAGLREAYKPYENATAHPTPVQESTLGARLADTSAGLFEIQDARLIGGTADQWKDAATVALHFTTTAHTVEDPPDGKPTPLGRLTWLRFRISFALPSAFKPDRAVKMDARSCSAL